MSDTANHAVDSCAIRLQTAKDFAAPYAAAPGVVVVFAGGIDIASIRARVSQTRAN